MFISKLSRVGVRFLKELSGVESSLLTRTACGPRSRYLQPLAGAFHIGKNNFAYLPYYFDMHCETKSSQSALLQYQHHFCTTTADVPHEEGTELKEKISVTFVDKDAEEHCIKVPIGMSMLEAGHENDIELEGACEGSLACSTCHVIVMDVEYYNKLDDPTDEENDMLDLAFGLTETSRLGCQVIARPELDGIRLALPAATRNFAVDGYVPKPH